MRASSRRRTPLDLLLEHPLDQVDPGPQRMQTGDERHRVDRHPAVRLRQIVGQVRRPHRQRPHKLLALRRNQIRNHPVDLATQPLEVDPRPPPLAQRRPNPAQRRTDRRATASPASNSSLVIGSHSQTDRGTGI